MPAYRAEPTRPDKAKAALAVAAIYAIAIGAALLMPGDAPRTAAEDDRTILVDIDSPPPVPPPAPPTPAVEPRRLEKPEGAAGKKAEPSPVVAPDPAVLLPARTPVEMAPVPGSGTARTAGAASSGSGPGAGGAGSGSGGGGGGGGIGAEARLLGGNSAPLPSRLLRSFAADQGSALLWLTVAATGRVSDCSVLRSSGSAEVDRALCVLMERKSRWSPARDRQGQPIPVKLRYTATWRKN